MTYYLGFAIAILVVLLLFVAERSTRIPTADNLNLRAARLRGNFLHRYHSGVAMDLILGTQKLVLNLAPTAAGAPSKVSSVNWVVTDPASGKVDVTSPDGLNAVFTPAKDGPYEVVVTGVNSAGAVLTAKTAGNVSLAPADNLGLTATVAPLAP